ncbi:MAG: lanthionine synthetase C family protein [Prevotellaceae bacterium]|jgi:lantibiotic modifying enzyme|nr:lanthionine synthetase C family protein [Prevotellaceae bacterium]
MDQPLLTKIDEIADLLQNRSNEGIGLYSGKAGISLFLFYYARFKNAKAVHQQATDELDGIFSQVEESPQRLFSFCSGIAGVGWLLNHLCKYGFLQEDPNELLSDVDEYLFKAAINDLDRKNFDFLHGAMGVVLYFVKRNRSDYLLHLVHALANIAVWDGEGAKWKSVLKHKGGLNGYNIAMSHGSSSIVLILCKILQFLPKDEATTKLLYGAVTYILQQEISVSQYGCYFPSFSIESQPDILKTRLAWCYGDLGVALALWKSGIVLQQQAWIDKGMEVLLYNSRRRGLPENGVQDAGICHGTSGIAQIFNRLYRHTKRIEFKDASGYWCGKTLSIATFEDGLAGYKTWYTPEHGGWQTNTNFLEGIAGIGLCLMSFVAPEDPAWDECLLLS